jgi:hypothetical protein
MVKSNTITFTVRKAVEYFNLSIDSGGIEDGIVYPISVHVYVDDVYVGDTPVTVRVSSGLHKLQVSAEAPYVFEFWGDGVTENPRTVNVVGDVSLTAYFRYVYFSLSVDSRGLEDGRVYPISIHVYIDDVYAGDTPLTWKVSAGSHKIYVSAEPPYSFEFWGDGSTENPRTVNVDRDMALTAYFRYVYQGLTLDSSDQYGVRIPTEFYIDDKYVGDAPVTVWISGEHKVEARSKMPWLYTWWRWSDGVTENPRRVNVVGYMYVTALFSRVEVSIVKNTISVPKSEYKSYEFVEVSGRLDFSAPLRSQAGIRIDKHVIYGSTGYDRYVGTITVTAPAGATYVTYSYRIGFTTPDIYTLYSEAYFAGEGKRVKSNSVTVTVGVIVR